MIVERMTTDNPKGCTEVTWNRAFVRGKAVWLRGLGEGGKDISLYDYVRRENPRMAERGDDEIAWDMYDIALDPNPSQYVLAYWLAVGLAETRTRLSLYEDTGLEPDEIMELAVAAYGDLGFSPHEIITMLELGAQNAGQELKEFLKDRSVAPTNFSKWKSTLTPELLLKEGYHSGVPYKSVMMTCSACPAHTCPRKVPGNLIHDAICEREFMKWANAPAGGGEE